MGKGGFCLPCHRFFSSLLYEQDAVSDNDMVISRVTTNQAGFCIWCSLLWVSSGRDVGQHWVRIEWWTRAQLGPGQPALLGGVPDDCRGVGQNDLWGSLATQCNLYICERLHWNSCSFSVIFWNVPGNSATLKAAHQEEYVLVTQVL